MSRAQFASIHSTLVVINNYSLKYIFFSKTMNFFPSPPTFQFPQKQSNSLTDQILKNIYGHEKIYI